MVCYEIPSELHAQVNLPVMEKCNNSDNNHGLGEEWTKLVISIKYPEKSSYSYYTSYNAFQVPRILYVKKSWTMQQVHLHFFVFFRKVFNNWNDLPEATKEDFELNLVRKEGENTETLTWDQFMQLTVEQ